MFNSKKEEFLELESRRLIYNHISSHPGLHFRELSREMQIPKSTLEYHLKYLEKRNLITIGQKDRYVRYYIAKKVDRETKKILSILREETPRRLLISMKIPNPVSLEYLTRDMDKAPSTISYHLSKLIKLGLVEKIRVNNKIKFGLKDEFKLYNYFIQYNKSLTDDFVSILIDWITRVNSDLKFRNIIAHICDTNAFIDGLYEIFPNPFCA